MDNAIEWAARHLEIDFRLSNKEIADGLKKKYGKTHTGGCDGGHDFVCDPEGIVIDYLENDCGKRYSWYAFAGIARALADSDASAAGNRPQAEGKGRKMDAIKELDKLIKVGDNAKMVQLSGIEARIAVHMETAYTGLLAVGRDLTEAKDAGLVAHGQWEDWVRRNTGMSERQAQKLMQAARSVLPGSALERLPISKIQAILSLPEPEREDMAEKAAQEDMSLRELQEAIRREKERALTAEQLAAKADDQLREMEQRLEKEKLEHLQQEGASKDTNGKLASEVLSLKRQLNDAMQAAAPQGISAQAQAEIDRLKAELDEAEDYAERQATLRQEAQQALLNRAAGNGGEPEDVARRFGRTELQRAVRSFIGDAGVLPQMGVMLSGLSERERSDMRAQIDTIAAWVEGSRRALDTIKLEL